ncbi:glycoside hydrolase family 17, F-box domain-containing protein [Artemisia annua]|uniref:Glycoside hydrolase family 17, F-box domain-containing protein n=1 Tax=Artemisia annua TaxID=35608 RepID=A0A2U1MV21_ARTAN|nr:glycoside hydrolase family 17, F-box domain-containing protein [Artemisia annua]
MKSAKKRCKKHCKAKHGSMKDVQVDPFNLLPDDILLLILMKVPGDVLRYSARFVYKRWFYLITYTILLDHVSFILETQTGSHKVRLVDISEEGEGITMNERYLELPYNGRIKSWCNEVLLITDLDKQGSLFFYNIITKEGSLLSQCSISCGGHYSCRCGIGLSYDKFKGVYKVVHVFNGPPVQCELIILGSSNISTCNSSKWKEYSGPIYTGQRGHHWDDPVSVQGRYLHWDVHCSEYLLSMDTVKETFCQTSLPVSEGFSHLVEMGGFLTLLHKVPSYEINIWVLKDFQRTKWEKLQSISTESVVYSSINPRRIPPIPVTSVKSQRYLIFRLPGCDSTTFYSYDLKDNFMTRLDIDIEYGERFIVHSTSASFFLSQVNIQDIQNLCK